MGSLRHLCGCFDPAASYVPGFTGMDEFWQLCVFCGEDHRIDGREPPADPADGNVILPETKIQD